MNEQMNGQPQVQVNIDAEVQQALGAMQIQLMVLQKQVAALQTENTALKEQINGPELPLAGKAEKRERVQ